jgi:hypothetical protein
MDDGGAVGSGDKTRDSGLKGEREKRAGVHSRRGVRRTGVKEVAGGMNQFTTWPCNLAASLRSQGLVKDETKPIFLI